MALGGGIAASFIAQKGYLNCCYCKRTSEESGTIGGRKEKEFVDDDLTTGKHPTI